MGEAARARHAVAVPERGAAATVDGQMLDVKPRSRRGQSRERRGRRGAAAVVDDETGQTQRGESIEDGADRVAVVEDGNQHTRVHAGRCGGRAQSQAAGGDDARVVPESKVQRAAVGRELDAQAHDVGGAQQTLELQRFDSAQRRGSAEDVPRGVEHPADLRDARHNGKPGKVSRQVLEIDGDLQKPLAAVRAPRMLEDSDAPFAQRPPPAVPGGNTRRSTGSSRSP